MTAIKAVGLTKRYKDKTAVDKLNLEINEGELFALLGVNGAGKTTTIKMLSCLTLPTDGDAFLLGKSIKTDTEKVKKLINLSPQETAVAPNLTVRENLVMTAGIYGFDKKEARLRTEKQLSDLGLSEYAEKKAKLLSGGVQRRLSIAMALISSPEILFLDEPTLGLDVLARRELWAAVEKLKGNITTVLTTHYMEEAEALSDRVGIMADGHLIDIDTPAGFIAKTGAKNFEEAFIAVATGKGGGVK